MERAASSQRFRNSGFYALMVIGGIIFLVPFIWLLLSSVKLDSELRTYPIQILPKRPIWENFSQAITVIPYFTYMGHSLFLATSHTIITVFTSAMVGYGFARHRAPGRDFLFILVVATVIVPRVILIIPQYIMYSRIGLINTYWPWILWGLAGSPFHIFLFRQFFMTFPKALEEAAILDGCSRFRIFWQIFLPNAKPVIIVTSIFAFTWVWGDFFSQALFLTDSKATLAMKMASAYLDPKGNPLYSLTMAGLVLYTLPLIIIFFVGQKHIVEGVVTSGVK